MPARLSPQAMLALSFLVLIVLGSILLSLPVSIKGDHVSYVDALFTATSATCVTGLIVVDTGGFWSPFGQAVILVLIQLGGLGIMTFTSFVILLFARRLGIWDRELLVQSFTGEAKQSIGRLLWSIILLTMTFEMVGATVLASRFAQDYPLSEAIYLGIFHAISAFCNAGFSLFQTSLIRYQSDLFVNITIMLLIICGGIGFWVLFDFNIFNFKKKKQPSLHTRLVLYVTLLLLALGFLLFLLIEWRSSLAHMPIGEKILAALFQSVTARTAGFNTVDITTLMNSSLFLLIILMIIGASPGSCGGGIKTTTFAIIVAMIAAKTKNRRQVQMLKRGVPDDTVSKAIGITASAIVIIGVICFLLLLTETSSHPRIHQRTLFIHVVFEAVSAFGTVGLSMGITPLLSLPGKMFIILLMYIGRLGPITLTLALSGMQTTNIRYAEDNIWVG